MVSFVNKEDLTSLSFDEKRLIPFPSAKENVKRNTAKSISFELFVVAECPGPSKTHDQYNYRWQNVIAVWNGSIENAKEFQIRFSKGQWNGFVMLVNNCVKDN